MRRKKLMATKNHAFLITGTLAGTLKRISPDGEVMKIPGKYIWGWSSPGGVAVVEKKPDGFYTTLIDEEGHKIASIKKRGVGGGINGDRYILYTDTRNLYMWLNGETFMVRPNIQTANADYMPGYVYYLLSNAIYCYDMEDGIEYREGRVADFVAGRGEVAVIKERGWKVSVFDSRLNFIRSMTLVGVFDLTLGRIHDFAYDGKNAYGLLYDKLYVMDRRKTPMRNAIDNVSAIAGKPGTKTVALLENGDIMFL